MSMFSKALGQILRRSPRTPEAAAPPTQVAPGATSPMPPAPPPVVARPSGPEDWMEDVRAAAAEGRLPDAFNGLAAAVKRPVDDVQLAARIAEEVVRPLLEACARAGEAANALRLESWTYGNLIKQIERKDHYERCLQAMDAPLASLGARESAPTAPGGSSERILFSFDNIQTELAHVHLLADILDAYLELRPDEGRNFGFVGYAQGPVSARIASLADRFGVMVHRVEDQMPLARLVAAGTTMTREGYGKMIVVALPVGLSYLCAWLGADRVGWLSMKFELEAVEGLRLRYSFCAGQRSVREIGTARWLAAPPLMRSLAPLAPSGRPLKALQDARAAFPVVLYTVNREQKIGDPGFLDAVCDLLDQLPQAAFVWTGASKPARIEAHFDARGLKGRQFFAGWVQPDDLLVGGDIFLDTPHLSGTVAARAMAFGRPVVSWSNAQSWINFFAVAIEAERSRASSGPLAQALDAAASRGLLLECPDAATYVKQALLLAQDEQVRAVFGDLLQQVAHTCFMNASAAAQAHVANWQGLPIEGATTA